MGGGVTDEGFIQSCDQMMKMNLNSAVMASAIAGNYVQRDGLLVLTGSTAGFGLTGGMIGYGFTKAATHHILESIRASEPPFHAFGMCI